MNRTFGEGPLSWERSGLTVCSAMRASMSEPRLDSIGLFLKARISATSPEHLDGGS